jgi:hypothetical protein
MRLPQKREKGNPYITASMIHPVTGNGDSRQTAEKLLMLL